MISEEPMTPKVKIKRVPVREKKKGNGERNIKN